MHKLGKLILAILSMLFGIAIFLFALFPLLNKSYITGGFFTFGGLVACLVIAGLIFIAGSILLAMALIKKK